MCGSRCVDPTENGQTGNAVLRNDRGYKVQFLYSQLFLRHLLHDAGTACWFHLEAYTLMTEYSPLPLSFSFSFCRSRNGNQDLRHARPVLDHCATPSALMF